VSFSPFPLLLFLLWLVPFEVRGSSRVGVAFYLERAVPHHEPYRGLKVQLRLASALLPSDMVCQAVNLELPM